MSISFSGLASGLDTSSWVESLVALKQAKITTLQEEKNSIEITQSTLDTVKTFFEAFRSSLTKLTEARIANISTDIFSQNIATSSDAGVITASASVSAKEATYNIIVDQLATNTSAGSNYATVYDKTTTATASSKLTDLSVGEGDDIVRLNIADSGSQIDITVNGITRGLTLTKNDTLATFAQKLNDIGVEAYYNSASGIFSVGSDDNAIDDHDTNLKEILQLKGVNEGYLTNTMKITQTETVYNAAQRSTKLSELGLDKSGKMYIKANDRTYEFNVTGNTTLGEFVDALNSNNIKAELDATGVFTIDDAEILTEGADNVVGLALQEAFGLAIDIYEKIQSTRNLTHNTLVTSVTTATTDTLIKDLGEGVTINSSNNSLQIVNSNNVTTNVTITNATKIGDLLSAMQNAGLSAQIDSNGQIEISGGVVRGGILSDLGLEENPYSAMVTGNALQETIVVHKTVDLQTKLVDDLLVTEGYMKITTPENTEYYEKIYSGQTIAQFMADMGNLGISTSLDEVNGILTITGGKFETLSDTDVADLIRQGKIVENEDRYKHGTNLLECLYGAPTISLANTSVSSTKARSMALTQKVTTVVDATGDTTLGTLGLNKNGSAVFTVRGEERTVNITKGMTIDGFISALNNAGISADFDKDTHRFSMENATLTSSTTNLSSVLDLTTEVSGKYKTSNELYSKETHVIDATLDSALSLFGISNSMSNAQKTVKVYYSDGTLKGSTVVSESTKISDLMNFVNAQSGMSAVLSDGVLTIHNGYIENEAIETAMGLEHSNKSSYVLGSVMTHTTVTEVTKDTTLGNIIDTLGNNSSVSGGYTLFFNSESIAVNANTTLDGLVNAIYAKGGTASVDSLGRLRIDGGTLTGTVATALGMTTVTNTSSVSATGEYQYTTVKVKADLDTKLEDLGLNSSSIVVHNTLGAAVTTINFTGTDTIGNVFAQLRNNGIDGTISDGVITLVSAEDKYITGNLADTFGISTQTVTSIVNTTQYSTAQLTHTGSVTATVETTLGEINAITANGQTFEIYREDGHCLATINNLTTSSTVGDMFDRLSAYGIQGTITNGIIELYSAEGNYATGTIMSNLGIGLQDGVAKTYTVAKTTTTTTPITFTNTVYAQEDEKISAYITLPSNKTITVYDKNHQAIGSAITLDNNSTFSDLFAGLAQKGLMATINDGVITFTPTDGQYATGDILTSLGVTLTETTATTTTGTANTGATISYTTTHTAQGDTTLKTVGINQNAWITMKNSQTGAVLGSFNVTGTTTFNQLAQSFDAYGMTMSIVDGVIHLDSDTSYAEGSILSSLGVSTTATTTTVTTTIAKSVTGSGAISYTTTTTATGSTTLGQIGIAAGSITIKNAETSQVIGSFNVQTTTSLNSLIDTLDNYGISASVVDGIFRVSSGDAYAEGAPLTALGISTSSVTTTVSTVVTTRGNDCNGSSVTYSVTNTAVGSTTLQTVGLNNNSYDITIKNAQTGASIATFSVAKTETFDSLASKLGNYGISAGMVDGIFRISSGDNYADASTLFTPLGISNMTVTTTAGTTVTTIGNSVTGSSKTYSVTNTAVGSTTLQTVGLNNNSYDITIKNAQTGASIATISVAKSDTFDTLASKLGNYGISAEMVDGIFRISSGDNYADASTLFTPLGISTTNVTTTVSTTVTTIGNSVTGSSKTYSVTNTAVGSTTLQTVGLNNNSYDITIKNAQTGASIATFSVAKTETFDSLASKLGNYGISAEMVDGIFRISSGDNYADASTLFTPLGISNMTVTTTVGTTVTTHGQATTSSAATSYSYYTWATEDTKISDTGLNAVGTTTIFNAFNGTSIATITTNANTTFRDLANALGTYGITAGITDGVFFMGSDNTYATGGVLNELGVGMETQTLTQTVTGTTSTTTVGRTATGTRGVRMLYAMPKAMTGTNTLMVNATVPLAQTGTNALSVTYSTTTTTPQAITGTNGHTYVYTQTVTTTNTITNPTAVTGSAGVMFTYTQTTTATVGIASEGTYVFTTNITQTTTATVTNPTAITGSNLVTYNGTVGGGYTSPTGAYITVNEYTTSPQAVTGTVTHQHTVTTNVVSTVTLPQTVTGTTYFSKPVTTTLTVPQAQTGTVSHMYTNTIYTTTTVMGVNTSDKIIDYNQHGFNTGSVIGTVTITSTMTVSQFISKLNNMSTVTATINSTTGAVTIKCETSLQGVGNLIYGQSMSYTQPDSNHLTITGYIRKPVATTTISTTQTVPMDTSMTLNQLTGLGNEINGGISVKNSTTGTSVSVTILGKDTLGTLIRYLDSKSIQATITDDGKLTLDPNGEWYVSYMGDTLTTGFGFNISSNYTTRTTTTYAGRTKAEIGTDKFFHDGTVTMTNAETGATSTFTLKANTTSVSEFFNKLQNTYSISTSVTDGHVTFTPTGKWYISGCDADVWDRFGIGTGNGSTYKVGTKTVQTTHTEWDTSFQNSAFTGTVSLKNSDTGETVTLTGYNHTDGVEDLLSTLQSSYSFQISLTNDGRVTLDPNGKWYIASVPSGLNTILGIATGVGNTYSTVLSSHTRPATLDDDFFAITGSSMQHLVVSVINSKTGATTYQNFGRTYNTAPTPNWRDVANWLDDYDIALTIDSNGRLVVNSTGDYYVTMSQGNAPYCSNPLSSFGITSLSNAESGAIIPNNNTKLSQLGINQNVIFTIKNANTGATSYFTFTSNSTMTDIGNTLAENGPNIFMSITDQGRLVFDPNGDCYIQDITAAFKTKFGLTTGAGNSWVTDTVTRTTTHTEPMALSNISMYRGANYTITLKNTDSGATQDIVVNSTTNNTAQKLANTLSPYNIGLQTDSEGHLVWTPTGDWYILSSSASMTTRGEFGLLGTYHSEERSVTHTEPVDIDKTLAQCGINQNVIFTFRNATTGETRYKTFASSATLGDIYGECLYGGYSIDMSIQNDGSLAFDPNGDWFIQDITAAFKNKFGLTTGAGNSWVTDTVYNTRTTTYTEPMVGTMTLNHIIGLNDGAYQNIELTNADTGAVATVSIKGSETLDTLFSRLSAYTIQSSITSDGNITFDPNGRWYISAMDNRFKSGFGFGDTVNLGGTYVTQTVSRTQAVGMTDIMSANLGVATFTISVTNTKTGQTEFLGGDTRFTYGYMGNLLSAYSITMGFTSDGRIQFTPSGDWYISAINMSSSDGCPQDYFRTTFGITLGEGHMYQNINTAFDMETPLTSVGLTGTTKYYITLKNDKTNQTTSVYVQGSENLTTLQNRLNAYDIELNTGDNGNLVISATGDWYVDGMNSQLANVFGLSTGDENSFTYMTWTDADRTLNQLTGQNITTNQYMTIVDSETGAVSSIAISGTDTISSIDQKLSPFGISAYTSVQNDGNGYLTLATRGKNFILSMPTILANAFDINAGEGNTFWTVTHDVPSRVLETTIRANTTSSNILTHNVTGTIDGNSKLVHISGDDTNITVKNGATGATATISVDGSMTVDSIMAALGGYDIAASLSGGKMSVNPNGDWYIQSPGALSQFGINASGTTTTTVHDVRTITENKTGTSVKTWNTTPYIDGNTKLSQFSATGNIVVKHGVTGDTQTIQINNDTTVAAMMGALGAYGISADLSADGKLTLDFVPGEYYIQTAGALSGFGITPTTRTTTVHNTQTITENKTGTSVKTWGTTPYINGNTLLSQFGATGNIVVKHGITGDTQTIQINNDTTVAAMMGALGAYGISADLSADGKLTLDFVPGEYYIQTAGALSGFGITPTTRTTTVHDTRTITENKTGTSVKTWGTTPYINGNTLLSQFNATGNIVVKHGINGDEHTINTSNMTVDGLMSALSAYGIQANLSNTGVLSLDFNDVYYIKTAGALSTFGLGNATATTTTTTYDTHTENVNTSGSTLRYYTTGLSMTMNTTFGELGWNGKQISMYNSETGNSDVFSANDSGTLGDLANWLASYSHSLSINNGVATIGTASNNKNYINTAQTSLLSALKISTNAGDHYTTTTANYTVGVNNTNGHTFTHNTTDAMSGDSTFKQIGQTANTTVTIKNANNQSAGTIGITSGMTVNDFLTAAAAYGISGAISSDGKLTVNFSDEYFFSDDATTAALLSKLGITGANTRTTYTTTTKKNNNSASQHRDVTTNMDANTTFSKLGLTAAANVVVGSKGLNGAMVYNTITVQTDQTVGDLAAALGGLGVTATISGGKLTLQGGTTSFVTSMDNSLKTALKINVGNNVSYEQKTSGTHYNDESNSLVMTKNTLIVDGSTVLKTIAGWNNGNGKLSIHQTNGQFTTIDVNQNGTLDDFFRQISAYGLTGTVSEDGKVNVVGAGNVYMQAVTGGSNIMTALKLGSRTDNVSTVTSNRTSSSLSHTITVTATGTTKLGDLLNSAGTKMTFNGNNVSLTLTTTSDAGNSTVTLSFTKSSTVYDVANQLASYGLDATIDTMGRFDLSSSTLNDFSIGGTLGTFLMGSYTKKYGTDTTYNISTNLLQKQVVNMTDSTKLSDLNVTSGNFEITQEGVAYTVNISNTSTVGDFRNLLAQYGINTHIDDEGRLTSYGVGESWLDSVSGGSNIVSKFGLDKNKWSLGEITQTSDKLEDTNVIVRKMNLDNKLSELTDESGNSLNITSGNIFVYQDGTRSTLYIDTNDTLQNLQSKLSQYGITMSVSSDGKIYFDGNNDSYMTAASSNSSNILTKIGAASNWSTRYDSTSQNLNYTVVTNETATRGAKLSELQDSDGNNLGITEGTYYVFENGVRKTETITEDTTVNDLMASMASHGLIADIGEDGAISVSGHNESYMKTSALGGKNSNIIENLFNSRWEFTNVYASNNLDAPEDVMMAITRETKLADIADGGYQAGKITVTKDGVQTQITLKADDTVGNLIDELALYGFEGMINDNGQLILRASGDSNLSAGSVAQGFSNALSILGVELKDWVQTNNYDGKELDVIKYSTATVAATRDTALSELLGADAAGEFNIYKNGVKFTALISSDETIGSFMDTLKSFGLETSLVEKDGAGILQIVGAGDTYIAESQSATNASNVCSLFTNNERTNRYSGLQQTSSIKTTQTTATEDTKISELNKEDSKDYTGVLTVNINGATSTMNIEEHDTIGDVLNKFRALGLEATINNGQILVQSGYDTLNVTSTNASIVSGANSLFTFKEDIGKDDNVKGFSASSLGVEKTVKVTDNLSVAKYIDGDTKLDLLNISEGTFTIYRNGQKGVVTIGADETFGSLLGKIQAKFSDVEFKYGDDGYFTIYSTQGNEIIAGATTDTTNISSILGLTSDGAGKMMSAKEQYCANINSKVTENGLFRHANVKEGTFTVGNATFTIDSSTTISDVVNMINNSYEAKAKAYWDNVNAKLVIEGNETGSTFVNIEAGTSNFTDVMGLTESDWDVGGNLIYTKINTKTQQIGTNAKFSINGTSYVSTNNKIDSSLTRLTGVTIDLNGVSEGEKVTLTIEKDKETLANAVQDVVDSYNNLMENLDKQISKTGTLKDETSLKLLRDNLRSLMTGSQSGTSVFRNLDAIGVKVANASANNVSTSTADITKLTFDKDKFFSALKASSYDVKTLLAGDSNDDSKGVLYKIEDLLIKNIDYSTGYFNTAKNSYSKQISNLNTKIKKATASVEKYKAMLENKFKTMDMLIAQMNQQYSTFLTN